MLIDCSYCKAKVDSEVLNAYICPPLEEGELSCKVSLVKCPSCKQGLLVGQYDIGVFDPNDEDVWSPPTRLWPDPKKYYWNLPPHVKVSVKEAELCFNAKAYNASTVMCRRALEAICTHYEVKAKTLEKGLKELLEKEIIDKKIYEWSNALRIHGNIGAHIKDEEISEEDAKDLFDFTNAICDYVFVLTKKFEKFMKRKGEKKKKKKKENPE